MSFYKLKPQNFSVIQHTTQCAPQNFLRCSVFSQFENELKNNCGLCSKIFLTKYMLRQHLSTTHQMSEVYISSYFESTNQKEFVVPADQEEQDEDDFEIVLNDNDIQKGIENTDRRLDRLMNERLQSF
ncbi:hypothetical protein EDC96DRAFT_549997 [Choanephora cucurbitarum]|nr:hypothetical protein EDC96DRAFT_549997 [Choanephora cucurbitarum]